MENDLHDVYRRIFGVPPPRNFRKAWRILCEAIYFGVSGSEEDPRIRKGKRASEHWPLHAWQLIETKDYAEKVLAEITRALLRWEAQGQVQGRPPPGDGSGADMARD